MTCSQRVFNYTLLESEDEIVKEGDKKLQDASWPAFGRIEFHNVTMKYRETLEPSLVDLTMTV